jgi:YgiT-type zinc finger domain-containing protein
MVRDTRDVLYTYKGQTTTIPNVSGEYCPACNESLHNAEESEYLNAAMLAFNKEVNGATVNPAFISETRKKLCGGSEILTNRQRVSIKGLQRNVFSGPVGILRSMIGFISELFNSIAKTAGEALAEFANEVESLVEETWKNDIEKMSSAASGGGTQSLELWNHAAASQTLAHALKQ